MYNKILIGFVTRSILKRAIESMDPNGTIEENQIAIINDYTGFSMKNSDKNGLRLLLDIVRVNYPGRAGSPHLQSL
jgi:hypothetical protein